MQEKSKKDILRERLLDGERLTHLQTWEQFGLYACSQRVGELRKEGMVIQSNRVPSESYNVYFMLPADIAAYHLHGGFEVDEAAEGLFA